MTSLIDTLGPTGTVATESYAYAYDKDSNVTLQTTPDGGSTLAYDHDNQLLSATSPGEVGTNEAYGVGHATANCTTAAGRHGHQRAPPPARITN